MNHSETSQIDWHSGFAGGLALSFRKYRDDIEIEREHPLSNEPLRIDFMVIKKDRDFVIDNSVGRTFRKYNIIEYKNPADTLIKQIAKMPAQFCTLSVLLPGLRKNKKI